MFFQWCIYFSLVPNADGLTWIHDLQRFLLTHLETLTRQVVLISNYVSHTKNYTNKNLSCRKMQRVHSREKFYYNKSLTVQ